ncbi:hypothetical protein LO763_07205 [Glycomyces sp. A-F 0318]|uniref:hypothetical protein n=1 Tax=Glycomyces amatae TaxID=2881355 RepID=UPI001E55E06E|nr:hypothetical protein [Glycomyces amatae]MCD0443413.1 hypothetical protein [Glycomyces amatae]
MMIAVGAPGEAIGPNMSAGLSMAMWSPGAGVSEYKNLTQDLDKNPDDTAEPGDAFGTAVAMVNRTPGQNTSTDTLLMAAGAPGEDDEAAGMHEVGEASLFSMTEAEAEGGDSVRAALEAAGIVLAEGGRLGSVLHATQTHLWVTVRSETDPAVYGVPWDNIVAGGTDPILAHTPEDFGLTAADTASFGASLA